MNYDAMGEAAFLKLARSFPSLEHALGLSPRWDAQALDAWAAGASSGQKHAVRFLLSLYNHDAKWRTGKFELARAISVWDESHVEAFFAWARIYRERLGRRQPAMKGQSDGA